MNFQEKLEREIGEEIKKDLKKLEEKYAVWGLGNQHAERLINKCTTYKDTGFAIRISDAYRGEYTRLYELKKQRSLSIINPSEAKKLRKMIKSPDTEIVSLADSILGVNRRKRLRKERYLKSKENGKSR